MTQAERILRHLTDFGSITQGEALQEYGIMRLASRVNDLRRDGVPIITEVVEGRNRYGEKTRFARYRIGSREKGVGSRRTTSSAPDGAPSHKAPDQREG